MMDLLSTLSERFDLVILDAPPPSVVPDALPLMRLVTGVVIVARKNVITRDAARQLRRNSATYTSRFSVSLLTDVRRVAPVTEDMPTRRTHRCAPLPHDTADLTLGAHPQLDLHEAAPEPSSMMARPGSDFPSHTPRQRRGPLFCQSIRAAPKLISSCSLMRVMLASPLSPLPCAHIGLRSRSPKRSLALALAALPLLAGAPAAVTRAGAWTHPHPHGTVLVGPWRTPLLPVCCCVCSRRRVFSSTPPHHVIDLALLAYLAIFVLGELLQYDQPPTWRIRPGSANNARLLPRSSCRTASSAPRRL